jgi:hypothetical protein
LSPLDFFGEGVADFFSTVLYMTADCADSADKDRRNTIFLVGFSRRSQVAEGMMLSSLKLRSDRTLLLPEAFLAMWSFFPAPVPDTDLRGILLVVDDSRGHEVEEAFNDRGCDGQSSDRSSR